MSPVEIKALERKAQLQMDAFHKQLTEPLVQKVTSSVKEVAEAQGLSLVTDKEHAIKGGRNVTNEVVKAFLKRIDARRPLEIRIDP